MEERTRIDLRFVQVNSTFIWPLFSEEGELIVKSRVPLSRSLLKDIRERYGNIVYYITTSYRSASTSSGDGFSPPEDETHDYDMVLRQAGSVLEEVISTQKISPETINETEKAIELLIENLENRDTQIVTLINEINHQDDYIKQHLVNVSILAFLFGKKFAHFSRSELKYLMLGSLLLDIGLVKLDDKLRNKEGEFSPSERQIIKRHPQLGYELLKTIEDISPIVLQVVLLHHEYVNGQGYYGLPYDSLPDVVKLVAVCDVFDALTSNRPYRPAYSMDHAMKVLVNLVDVQFERRFIDSFLNKVAPYISGEDVFYAVDDICELDTGEMALIKKRSIHDVLEPTVTIFGRFERENGRPHLRFNSHTVDVNLENDPTRSLQRFIISKSQSESILGVLKNKGFIL